MKLFFTLLLLILVGLAHQDEEAPRVKTPLGGIKGYYKVSQNGRKYEAYEGIPYAIPPTGKLRFKPPQRIPAWTGELSATKFGSMCLQYAMVSKDPLDRVVGAEDCLYLNVYVPVRATPKEPLPVLFWIHDGAFQFGSGMLSGAKYLMDRDVVFVTFNYRLGPLGFLSTEDDVVPGNMGLKDQNMALRWVSENIEWFGGDPKKVTLVGLSAGAASVHYHYLTPLSAGLFQGGLSISGTAFDCWTQAENALEKAKKLGALMGCPTTSTREMMRCLRYRPARTLVQAVNEFMVFYYNPFTPFGPVAEKTGDTPFIDRSPAEIVDSGDVQDVPWITGVTSEEGLWPVTEFMMNEDALRELEEKWDDIAPHFLDFNNTVPKERHSECSRAIKKHYFGSKPISKSTWKELEKLASDRFFITDSERAARAQAMANKNPVWFYYYSYRGQHSLTEIFTNNSENYGVSHADDALLVVDSPFLNPTTTKEDVAMQQLLIDLWVSFATHGVPRVGDVEWQRVDPTKKELVHLHIEAPGKVSMKIVTNLGERNFWDSLNLNENKVTHGTSNVKDEF